MSLLITSFQNPLIKQLVKLKEKSRYRKTEKLFVIEGIRELELAIKGNYKLVNILYCKALIQQEILDRLMQKKTEPIEISRSVYEKIAYRGSTEGVMAIAQIKKHSLEQLQFKRKNPLILVAEAPEKPGNIGALLRTSDAADLDAVVIANPKTDLYNPNIIRSSVGCVFTNQVATATTPEIIAYLKKNNITMYCAALTASKPYHTVNYKNPSALVVGTESSGLSHEWLAQSDQNIIIPMQGVIDSLNVSVSAAILIFEAGRQRDFV